jgi:hypothetical protein
MLEKPTVSFTSGEPSNSAGWKKEEFFVMWRNPEVELRPYVISTLIGDVYPFPLERRFFEDPYGCAAEGQCRMARRFGSSPRCSFNPSPPSLLRSGI